MGTEFNSLTFKFSCCLVKDPHLEELGDMGGALVPGPRSWGAHPGGEQAIKVSSNLLLRTQPAV